jgi:hypothetical protein
LFDFFNQSRVQVQVLRGSIHLPHGDIEGIDLFFHEKETSREEMPEFYRPL